MFASYMDYVNYYTDIPDEVTFNRLSFLAEKDVVNECTGVDGVSKLHVAFPVDEYARESVIRCICDLVHMRMHEEQEAENAGGWIKMEDGTVHSAIANSISSGGESISFATPKASTQTSADIQNARRETVEAYLRGVTDANGVNLLYRGVYPYTRF